MTVAETILPCRENVLADFRVIVKSLRCLDPPPKRIDDIFLGAKLMAELQLIRLGLKRQEAQQLLLAILQ